VFFNLILVPGQTSALDRTWACITSPAAQCLGTAFLGIDGGAFEHAFVGLEHRCAQM
jgi:hypothetical protein